jgi:all-trans-retinol 13,14-reductase
MAYDAVVVGSGVAGMTAGIVLAKAGWKVLVLEQHRTAGGLMASFVRGGSHFAVGVHSIGAAAEGQLLRRYLQYLGVLGRVRLAPMDVGGFEEYRFPGLSFRAPCGHEAFRERLVEHFPAERRAADRFVADMRSTVQLFPLYNLTAGADRLPSGLQRAPLAVYLDGLTGSTELKAVLSACSPRYGISPAECPAHVHFLVLDSYLRSAWRVDEAHCRLAGAYEESLRESGGELRCGARVAAIECPERVAQGVRLADGEVIPAKAVVFTGHPKQLTGLCGGGLRPAFRQRLVDTPDTPGAFGAAIVWKGPDCPLVARDVFIYDTWDIQQAYVRKLLPGDGRPQMLYCAASARARDGNFAVMALCSLSIDELAPAAAAARAERPEGYAEIKRSMGERVLAVMRSEWPENAGLEVLETFTPFTVRDYTLSPSGSAYGLSSARLTAVTRIAGLYLAGQSIVLPGMLGALISAVDACGAILGRAELVGRIVEETK